MYLDFSKNNIDIITINRNLRSENIPEIKSLRDFLWIIKSTDKNNIK